MPPILARSPPARHDDPFFQDARLEPLLDQTDHARVADPVVQELDQPLLADFVERGHDRLPITKTFRSPPSSRVSGIRLKDADFLSSGA